MPTYDYVCEDCQQRFDVFLSYSEYGKVPVTCAHCGSSKVRRRMTKVRIARSEESRMESLVDDSSLEGRVRGPSVGGLENDPKALGPIMKKMGNEMGEDLPPEFDDVVDRLEAGQSPEDIESALPDLGTGGGDDEEP
jgi:putative FmdB family regulatory protein